MRITFLGEPRNYPTGTSVGDLIEQEKVTNALYATISLNGQFVDKGDLESRLLADGDEVEVLYFMGGGR